MTTVPHATLESDHQMADQEVVSRVLAGESRLFEILIRRYNQRLYRVARSIVRDEDEAEDIMQDAYVRAFGKLHQFEGRAEFSTWLTRIAVYEALARRRKRDRWVPLEGGSTEGVSEIEARTPQPRSPEDRVGDRELLSFLTEAVDALPESHRAVVMLRAVEGMSTADTSYCLGISSENVRVRMHRARSQLRSNLEHRLGISLERLFEFHLRRCDRLTRNVLQRIAETTSPTSGP